MTSSERAQSVGNGLGEPTTVSRVPPNTSLTEAFITVWLESPSGQSTYTKFRHILLAERRGVRDHIFEALARTVFTHHNEPEEYKGIVAELGFEQAAQEFDKRPRDDKTRKGNFGEVLASEYLRQVEHYELPVYRLRWNTNPDTSLRGEDALAFKFGNPDGSGREICVVESKVMSTFDRGEVAAAHSQLSTELRPRPTSLPFIHSVLQATGQYEKAHMVLAFQKRVGSALPLHKSFMMVTTGNRPRSPFRVIEEMPSVVANLTTASLSLPNLNELVAQLFEAEVHLGDA